MMSKGNWQQAWVLDPWESDVKADSLKAVAVDTEVNAAEKVFMGNEILLLIIIICIIIVIIILS